MIISISPTIISNHQQTEPDVTMNIIVTSGHMLIFNVISFYVKTGHFIFAINCSKIK